MKIPQDVLDATLGKYRELGFTLTEPDDHTVELWCKDELLDRFTYFVPVLAIRNRCDEYLKDLDELCELIP